MADEKDANQIEMTATWHLSGRPVAEGTYLICLKDERYKIVLFYRRGSIISQVQTRIGTYNAVIAEDDDFFEFNRDDCKFHAVVRSLITAWMKLPEPETLVDLFAKKGVR